MTIFDRCDRAFLQLLSLQRTWETSDEGGIRTERSEKEAEVADLSLDTCHHPKFNQELEIFGL